MNKLGQALEICITRLQLEGASLEDCLRDYPELSSELKPLLVAAQKMGSLRDLQPSAQYKTRLRGTLFAQMAAKPRPGFWRQPVTLRYAASLAVLILAFVTTGTALAQRALPGDALYRWKLDSEDIWRSLQQDQVGADLTLTQRRLDELMAIHGIPELEEAAIDTYAILLLRLGEGLAANPAKVAGAQEVLNWQKEELKQFYEGTQSNIPDLDALFDVIPDVDSHQPEEQTPVDGDSNPDIAIPPVIPALPPLKKEDAPAEPGEDESTILP